MVRRIKFFSVGLLLILGTSSLVNAGITDWNCDDDDDGVIVMTYVDLLEEAVGEYTLDIDCTQALWDYGHIEGDFTVDGDPSVRIIEDVLNDTSFAWTDYHITIGMTQTFSFVPSGLLVPAGWNATIIGT